MQSHVNSQLDFYDDLGAWHSYQPPEFYFLKERNSYERIAGQAYFTNSGMEQGLERIAACLGLSAETLAP